MAKLADIKNWWQRTVASGQLHPSYLIYGDGNLSHLAGLLTNHLEFGDFTSTQAPLDTLWLSNLGVDSVRSARRFLSTKPVISPRRSIIIPSADQLTPEAQNALLKISEAADRPVLIFLLTHRQDNLLPTIRSRFFSLYFPASPEDTKTYQSSSAVNHARQFLSYSSSARRRLIDLIVKNETGPIPDPNLPSTQDFLAALSELAGEHRLENAGRVFDYLSSFSEYNLNRRLTLLAVSSLLPTTA